MITAIVQRVETMLKDSGRDDVEVEIVFPVSPDAISTEGQATLFAAPLTLPNGLTIIPGAASGELLMDALLLSRRAAACVTRHGFPRSLFRHPAPHQSDMCSSPPPALAGFCSSMPSTRVCNWQARAVPARVAVRRARS